MPEQTIISPLQAIGNSIVAFIPNLISAIVILIIGIIIAAVIGKIVTTLLRRLRVNEAAERFGLKKMAGDGFDLSGFVGWLVEWLIIFVFLVPVADTLGLPQISEFINDIVAYIPNIIVAAVIVILGIVVANALSKIIEGAAGAAKGIPSSLIGNLVRWAVIIFTAFAALVQLRIAPSIIQILFAGIVATLVIALGLAFGLGGREAAQKLLEDLSLRTMKKR
jgi:hypothetical protein